MSTEIDKRVVEMQFDNKQFERNVQASLNTIDKLKMALNFDGAKGLDSITKAANKMDLSNISKQTESVKLQFSAIQVAGMTMVSELTKSFMNFGKNLWNISFGQIRSGGMARALKIEQADFKMKALVDKMERFKDNSAAAAQYIKDMGDAIDWAVTGTAYGYDSAASVAAQLMASGHDDVEQMRKDLRAVAGAAAMTGRSYDDMGRIFASVAGQGKMMGDQLLQFSNGGINAAATIAGYLHKTEAEVRKMVSQGKIDYQTFADAMYDAYGEAAGRADETYAGVLSNVKAQLSRLGQRFARPYINNMIPFLQQLKATIKSISATLQPVADRFDKIFGKLTKYGASLLKSFNTAKLTIGFRSLENVLWGIAMVLHAIYDGFREAFPKKTTEEVISLATSIEAFTEQILPTKEALDGIRSIVVSILVPFRVLAKLFGVLTKFARPLIASLIRIVYAITSIFRVLEPIAMGLLDTLLGGVDILDVALNAVTTVIIYLSATLQILIVLLSDAIVAFMQSDRIAKFGEALKGVADTITRYLLGALVFVADAIFGIIDKIQNADEGTSWFSRLATNAGILWETIKQLGSGLAMFFNDADSISGLKSIINLLKETTGLIVNFFKGNDITGNIDGISSSIETLGDRMEQLKEKFKYAWDNLDKGTLVMALFAVSLLLLMNSLRGAVDSATDFMHAVTDLPKIFKDIREAIKELGAFTGPAQMLLAFAAAVSSLTASIVTLSKLPRKDLKAAAIAIGSLSVILLGFILTISLLSKKVGEKEKIIDNSAVNLLALTASIVALAMSLKMIASMEITMEKLFATVSAVIVIMVSFVGVVYLINKISPKLEGSLLTMVGFSASIMLLAKAFQMLGDIDLENLIQKMTAFGGMILMFGAAIGMAGNASGWAMLTISSFTTSVIVLFGLFMLLTTIPMDLITGAIEMGTRVFNMFIPLILSIGLASKMAGKGTKLGGTIWALVMSMTAFLVTFMVFVQMVSNTDTEVLKKSLETIKSIVLYVGAFVSAVMLIDVLMALIVASDKKALANSLRANNTFKNIAAMIMALGAAVLMMGLAAKAMNGVDDGVIDAIAFYVGEIIVLVGVMALLSKKTVAGGNRFAPVIAMLGSLAIIVAALIAFQFGDQDKLFMSSVTLFIAISAISILFLAWAKLQEVRQKAGKAKKKDSDNDISMLLSLLGLIAAFTALLVVANNVDEVKALSLTGALIAMIGVMAVIVASFTKIPMIKYKRAEGGILALYALLPAVGALCLALYGLSKVKINNIAHLVGMFVGLSVVLAALTGLIAFIATKMSRNQIDKMVGISESIVLASLSFSIIAGAFMIMHEAIKDVDADGLVYMIGALGGLFVAMMVFLELAQIIPGANASTFLATGGAMAIMALGIVEIASAFAILKSSGATPDEIKAYGIAIGIMVAALSAVGAVLGFLGTPALAGIVGLASAFLEFGAGMDFVSAACLSLAEAVKVLGSVTAKEMNNVIDSIVAFLNRTNDIVDAYKKAYPTIVEGIALLFRSIGVAIGTVIGEIFAQLLVIGTAALVDNIGIFLSGCYTILRAFTDWLMSSDTLQLIYDAFYALGRAALLALAGLIEGLTGIEIQIDAVIDKANGTNDEVKWEDVEAGAEQFYKENLSGTAEMEQELNHFKNQYESVMYNLAKYSQIPFEEMSDSQKEMYRRTIELYDELAKEAVDKQYFLSTEEKNVGSEEANRTKTYVRMYEAMYDALQQDDEAFNRFLTGYYAYGEDRDRISEEFKRREDFTGTVWEDDSYQIFKDEGNNRIEFIDNYFNRIKEFENSRDEVKQTLHELGLNVKKETAYVTAAGQTVDEFGNVTDVVEIKLNNATVAVNENGLAVAGAAEITDNFGSSLQDIDKELSGTADAANEAAKGYSSFDDNINHKMVTPKIDTSNIEAMHNKIMGAEKGLKGITKAGENVDLTNVSENTDDATTSTNDFTTSVDSANNMEELFTVIQNKAGNAIINFAKDVKIGEKSLASYGAEWASSIDMMTGGKYNLGAYFQDSSTAMFKTAEEARKYGMEMVDAPWAPSGTYKIPRWQSYVEGTKRMYTDIEDFVNKNTATGRNAFYNAFGLSDDPDEALDEAANKITDAFSGITSGLGDYGDATEYAADHTDNLQSSIENTLDVFTEFNKEVDLSSREVLKNFMSQIDGIQSWEKELKELASRGFNQNFIKELADAGPQSYERVHALYKMTENDMSLFNKMYAEKLSIQTDTAKDIRQSFVDAGIMDKDEYDKFATEIGTKYDEAVRKAQQEAASKKNGQMSASTKKNLDSMYSEIEKYQADSDFMNKWLDTNAKIGEEGAESLTETLAEKTEEGIIGSAAYIEAGKDMVEEIDNGIEDAAPTIFKHFEELGLSSIEALKKSLELEKALTPVNEFRKGVYNQVKSSLKLFDEVKVKTDKEIKEEQISTTQMLYNMNENLKRVGKWSYQLRQLAAKGMSEGLVEELRQMGPEAADKVDAFARMSADELKMANKYYEESIQLPGQVADRMTSTYAEQGFSMALGLVKGIDEGKDDILSKMYEVGTESSEGFKQGIDPDAAKEAMEMLGNNSLESICKILDVNSPSKETEQIGEWTTEGYLIGVKSGIDKVVTLFKSIAEKSIKTLSENLSMSKFVSIGENIARGIEIGLKNGTNMLTNSVSSIASIIMSTFTTRMGIKSPSRVFAEYGNMLALGLCKGLKDSKSKIDDTIEETGEGISAQMAYIMYELGISLERYNKLLNDNPAYYPSITDDAAKNYYAKDPNRLAEARFWYNNHMMSDKEYANPTWYLYGGNNAMTDDLSDFRKHYISDWLYGDQGESYSYFLEHRDELFGNGLVDLSNISASTLKTSEATNEISIAFKEFSNRLTDFQREITNLGDRIDGMGVYINGDALVGEIVAPMDARMGRKVISQKRGRM